ncbi:MAG: PAS domain S-box protein, partial [Polyangiaceae bacterium]
MSGGEATEIRRQVEVLDRKRRMRNTRALAVGLAVMAGVMPLPMWLAGIDAPVAIVTLAGALGFVAVAWATRTHWGGAAAVLLNAFLAVMLFAGVAANRQLGPGPAFVGFSLFVAVATLPLRGVIAAGFASVLNVAAMTFVSRGVPQVVETPVIALTYGLALCFVTTLLGVVATTNAYGAIEKVVERERRAVAAEARASESEARYRLITDSMSDLVALLDEGSRFLYATPSFARVLGVDPGELVGVECFELVLPDDRASAHATFAEALARGNARGSYRCRGK